MTVMVSNELVTVGRIVGPHGVKGSIKLQPLTDYPQRFYDMPQLQLYTREGAFIRSLTVLKVRVLESKGYLLIDTDEIHDRNSAEALRGTLVKIAKSERHDLSEDEYWADEIIGLKAVNSETGEELGQVTNIIDVGENDLYEILTVEGRSIYVPAVSQFIEKIDLENLIIEIKVIEGLLDL